jgi:hypothetical protein
MVLAGMATVGISTASAATTTPTVVLSNGKAIVGQGPIAITATTSVAGAVSFTAATTAISGCAAVATITTPATATTPASITATCLWTASAPGAVILGATFVPTDTTDFSTATAAAYTVNVAVPVQTVVSLSPIPLYVDTIVASSATYAKAIAPIYGGCQITNEFLVGQTVVFRAFGYAQDGTPLTNTNVSSATVTIQGVTAPIPMSFANHGVTNTTHTGTDGVAFWTAPLPTGGTGYSTLGLIPYTITFKTIAVPAVTKKVPATRWVLLRKKGKVVHVNGKVVYIAQQYKKTVIVTPAVAGATGTFTPNFNTSSSATLNAVPAS